LEELEIGGPAGTFFFPNLLVCFGIDSELLERIGNQLGSPELLLFKFNCWKFGVFGLPQRPNP